MSTKSDRLYPAASVFAKIFILNQSQEYLEITLDILHRIFKKGSIKEIVALKPSFVNLVPLLIDSEDEERMELLEEYLEISFECMHLSLKEQSEVVYPFLKSMNLSVTLNSLIDENVIKQLLNLYSKWTIYLFINPKYLKEIIKDVSTFVSIYANKTEHFHLVLEKHFSDFLNQILDLNFHHSLEEPSFCQESVENYSAWVIENMKNMNVDNAFLISAFKFYLDQLFDRLANQQIPEKKFLTEFGKFIELYPPVPLILINNGEQLSFLHSHHQIYCEQILKRMFNLGIAKNYPDDFLVFELEMSYKISNIQANKHHRPIFDKLIAKFLNYNNPYCISRSIQLFFQIFSIPGEELIKLGSHYEFFLKAIRQYPKNCVQHHQVSYGLLFDYLEQNTFQYVPKTRPFRKHRLELYNIFFEHALQYVKDLSLNPEDGPYQAFYLLKCFEILKNQAGLGFFENQFPHFLSILKELFPIVKNILITHEYYYKQTIPINTLVPMTLFMEWLEVLIKTPLQKRNQSGNINIKASEKLEQRKLFYDCLTSFLQDKDNNQVLICECLMLAFKTVLNLEKPQASFWIHPKQKDALQLLN